MYRALIATLLMISAAAETFGQSGEQTALQTDELTADFESYPKMDADYSHLQLDLSVDESGSLDGVASWSFRLLRSDIDTLLLDAVGLDVQSVVMGGEELDYTATDEKLVILLPDEMETQTVYMLRVNYEALPEFGIHNDEWEMIRSSLLPGAVRHWLPVFDHPGNHVTTDVTLSYAAGSTASFSGSPSLTGIVSVEQQQMRFVSDEPVPVTSLTFATGISDRSQITSGRNRIHMMARSDLLESDEMNNLLETAGNSLLQAASVTGTDYQFRDLQIVVLDDNRWETKNYGAGIIYAYSSDGSLEDQIIRGVAAQWYGVGLVEEQWSDAGAINLLQESLFRELSGGVSTGELSAVSDSAETDFTRSGVVEMNGNSLYNAFSPATGSRWYNWLQSSGGTAVREALETSRPYNLLQDRPVLTWRHFADFIYSETGLPMMTPPDLTPESQPEVTDDESREYSYTVNYTMDDGETTLRLEFEADGEPVDDLVPLIAHEYRLQEVVERELSFTGVSDEVVLSISPGINNLDLVPAEGVNIDIELKQQKPMMFWIYQLRNSDEPTKRIEAAEGLRQYAENPDLQLALMDVLQREEDALVSAAILGTIAEVTDGAAGTSRLFLQRYDATAPVEHKLAIIDAYTHYAGNEEVINRLQQIVADTENRAVQVSAIQALSIVADAERFLAITQTLIPNPDVTSQVPLLLRHLAEKGEAEQAVRLAGALLNPGYSYDLRLGGLNLLLDYDESEEGWEERLPGLLTDGDPRIRYRAIDGLDYLSSQARERLVEERLENEYDERVITRLQSQ